ncbi:MAG: DUF817 family protein [Rhodobacter sp.]|uniref:DUF817 family protein n=1 Tax=Pararhodobacter sp. TaxID=2127056 RepID=UPI001D7F9699|nr:DUF817 family protein [Pararhodobacter sp.]MCB1346797.1 DUF817 family protein [Paracoccaceae bacterium]MCC0072063.1 DUF817 family protein [Rhodobacter sp.]HPD93381.1 DUF817 family protein [Pararhodobacter sp.]
MFVLKHLWAGLYGGVLLVAIGVSTLVWRDDWALARNDALFLIALGTQALFLALRLESREEVAALVGFSALGMGMEWYNTAAGHWTYPDTGLFALGDVPLFVGAMYAAVGVCVLRMIRIFEMRFVPFPPLWPTLGLTLAIYVNFFTQHVWIDLRLGLMVATVLLFGRTWIVFTPAAGRRWRMPMLLSLALSALGVWLAENLGTLTGTWLYDGQETHDPVSLGTLGSWYLFLCVALMVALAALPQATRPEES